MSVRSAARGDNAYRAAARVLAVLAALVATTGAAPPGAAVRPGIDVWRDRGFAPLQGRRIGLVTNLTGRTAAGRSTIDVLAAASEVRLVMILSPEHGLEAALEGAVEDSLYRGLPVRSLYGATNRPTAAMLGDLDALVFDIQDIGARFYTYASTLAYCMEEAADAGLPIVVLDRPNPISGVHVSGPVLDPALRSIVGYASIPTRHGMTLGELARYFNAEHQIGADLHVVAAEGWRRADWFDQTGLAWVDPSPNIRTLTQATLYPAVAPIEQTNVSVGRGTDAPFEWFGAPWIDARELAEALNAADLPGVRFVPRHHRPTAGPHADNDCGGVNLLLVDRDRFDAGLTSATLATVLHRLYSETWDTAPLPRLWGDRTILEQLEAGLTPERIVAQWQPALTQFMERRARYLLYP